MTVTSGEAPADPASVRRSEPDYQFDFCGGHAAVDFTNTVGNRGGVPEEHLNTFGDLAAWAQGRGILSRVQAARLRRRAAASPGEARRALGRAIELRDILYDVMARRASGTTVPADLICRLNRYVTGTFGRARLEPAGSRFDLSTPPAGEFDAVLTPVVRAAVDLLTSDAAGHLGMCADSTCAWLFLDTTRNRTRRWCDMKACGNRNKVRRFRRAVEHPI